MIAKRKAEELPVASKKAKLGNTAKKADTKGATEAQNKGCLSFLPSHRHAYRAHAR